MLWKRLAPPLSSFARQGLSRPVRPHGRILQYTGKRFNSNPQNTGKYSPDPAEQNEEEDQGRGQKNDSEPNVKSTILKMLETAATTAASIFILGYDCCLHTRLGRA